MKITHYRFLAVTLLTSLTTILIIACASPPLVLPERENVSQSGSSAVQATPEIVGGSSNSPLAPPTPEQVSTPLATPTQAQTPTPVPPQPPQPIAPVPTVVSIASQDLVTTDSLADGLKIVYAETDGPAGETKIWMSNVTQLNKRELLTIGLHKPRYGPGGKISPDSSKLFYTLTSASLSEKEAYRGGKELWILDIKSGKQAKLLESVNGFIEWLPDSRVIIYSQNKYNDLGGVETKVYLTPIDNWQERLVFSIDTYFTPLGFLDNQTLLYLEGKSDTLSEVRKLNLNSGQTELLTEIRIPQPWTFNLSPDDSTLLITKDNANSAQYELIFVSLTTGEQKTILTHPYNSSEESNNPINRLDARWTPNARQLLIHFPPQANQSSYLGLIDASTDQKISIQPLLDNTSFLEKVPEYQNLQPYLISGHWSPNGEWLTLLKYPLQDREVYVLNVATNTMTRIPSTDPSHWISIMGWIEGKPQ